MKLSLPSKPSFAFTGTALGAFDVGHGSPECLIEEMLCVSSTVFGLKDTKHPQRDINHSESPCSSLCIFSFQEPVKTFQVQPHGHCIVVVSLHTQVAGGAGMLLSTYSFCSSSTGFTHSLQPNCMRDGGDRTGTAHSM